MPRVNVDGFGVVNFPDGMPPSEMQRIIETEILPKIGKPQAATSSATDDGWSAANVTGAIAEPVASMASGMVAKPVSDVVGLLSVPLHAAGIISKDPLKIKEDLQRAMTYAPRTEAGAAVNEYNPLALLGRGVDWLGQQAEDAIAPEGNAGGPSAEFRRALARGTHEAINQAPAFVGMKSPAAVDAAAAALKGGARDVMQSALKPDLAALRKGQHTKAIDTLLDEGINVTKGGMETLQGRVELLNGKIADALNNAPVATVNKQAVGYRLQDAIDKAMKQVDAAPDVAAIQKVWDNFLDHPLLSGSDQIPVKLAQEMKQGTYKSLGSKAYGELKGAEIEAQKALARGLKEEIASVVPEVRQLNAQESQMLNALSLVERRALMEANKNPAGLGWLTTSPSKFAAFMADRSGLFKSLVARMLNTSSEIVGGSGLGAAGSAAGFGVGGYAQQLD